MYKEGRGRGSRRKDTRPKTSQCGDCDYRFQCKPAQIRGHENLDTCELKLTRAIQARGTGFAPKGSGVGRTPSRKLGRD
jgi:hypothetical protein